MELIYHKRLMIQVSRLVGFEAHRSHLRACASRRRTLCLRRGHAPVFLGRATFPPIASPTRSTEFTRRGGQTSGTTKVVRHDVRHTCSTLPSHRELANGTLRALISEAGLTKGTSPS
jgi:hypothetical protein